MKNTATIKVVKGIAEMHRFSLEARKHGAKIALVPTMGALHAGHLSLVKAARKKADTVVASIFVNPLQFGPREDLSTYPRDLSGDLAKLADLGVAVAFTPAAAEVFPSEHRTYIEVADLSQRLCGRARPTHFRGVATVVAKLLAIVRPHHVWFGRKDYQQLLIVRRMVRDLNFDVEVFDVPTVRDADGLALSSRNAYLTAEQRPAALTLQLALQVATRIISKGERSAAKILSNVREVIRAQPGAEIEYLSICHPETLHELDAVEVRTLVAVAARVGRTRLIDNALIDLRELGQRSELAKPAAVPPGPSPRPIPVAVKPPAKTVAVKPPARPSAGKPSGTPAMKRITKPAAKPAPLKPAAAKPENPAAKKPAAKPPSGTAQR